MKLAIKLKSGALQFAVFVAVVIALLLGGLMLYAYTFGYMKEQSKGAIENIQLADDGINYLLNSTELNSNDTLALKLREKENQSVKVHLSQWGVFQKAVALAQFRKKKFIKTAILGSSIDAATASTLFLQNTYNPLTVVGNTKINGNAFLPEAGIKSGYIAGNSYYGSQLIYGNAEKSTDVLPALDTNTLKGIVFYLKDYQPINQQDYISIDHAKKTIQSFKENTKSVYSKEAIVIENQYISGNIIIKSDILIQVKKTAILKDLILIAPSIEIEDETEGNFQAIASKRISVGKNCDLRFPTALVVYQENKEQLPIYSGNTTEIPIFIDTATSLKGSVCYYQDKEETDFSTQIKIEEQVKLKGQVYCKGNLELKGTVSGSVYTRQFVANQAGSIFVNHLYNAVIENENIPKFYGGIIFEKEPKTVLKWLY
ncbi:hypothetical protein [Flavobacterium seoulense]|uniref:Uncharacterized protein n=1 Tax=Flavobacterium seoulense TaxID=1492738 RepID=A0A066WVK5_9FLAO|nr:hypothetical protein [Flavobacterium seoulense]KDN54700.1 hypothetical protein FEM21_22140 [Flavobacterium seoulense]